MDVQGSFVDIYGSFVDIESMQHRSSHGLALAIQQGMIDIQGFLVDMYGSFADI